MLDNDWIVANCYIYKFNTIKQHRLLDDNLNYNLMLKFCCPKRVTLLIVLLKKIHVGSTG